VMRAHPNSNLDGLTELSFEFDQAGKIIDCIGTIKVRRNGQQICLILSSRKYRSTLLSSMPPGFPGIPMIFEECRTSTASSALSPMVNRL